VKLHIPKALTAGKGHIEVLLNVKAWTPRDTDPANTDDRKLGLQVFSAELTAM
jgi:hypothetical protein